MYFFILKVSVLDRDDYLCYKHIELSEVSQSLFFGSKYEKENSTQTSTEERKKNSAEAREENKNVIHFSRSNEESDRI